MKNIIPQALLTMPILSTGLQAQEKQPTPNLSSSWPTNIVEMPSVASVKNL